MTGTVKIYVYSFKFLFHPSLSEKGCSFIQAQTNTVLMLAFYLFSLEMCDTWMYQGIFLDSGTFSYFSFMCTVRQLFKASIKIKQTFSN